MRHLLLALPLLCGGCLASPSADFIKALGQDTASLCVSVTTLYGNLIVARTNYPSATVNCGPAALSHGGGTSIIAPASMQLQVIHP